MALQSRGPDFVDDRAGFASVVVVVSMLMLGALTLVRERERGSWETLLATPVDAIDTLIGKLSLTS